MAASVGNSDSVPLDVKVGVGGEERELLGVSKASAEKSSPCSDDKDKKTSCSRAASLNIDDSLVKVIASGGVMAENIESPGKTVCTAQVLNSSINQSRCLGGGDVLKLHSNASKDVTKLPANHDPEKQEPQINNDNLDGNHVSTLSKSSAPVKPNVVPSSATTCEKLSVEQSDDLISSGRTVTTLGKATELDDKGKRSLVESKLASTNTCGGNVSKIMNKVIANEVQETKSPASEVTKPVSKNICPVPSEVTKPASEKTCPVPSEVTKPIHQIKIAHQEISEAVSEVLDKSMVESKTIAQGTSLLEMKTVQKSTTATAQDVSDNVTESRTLTSKVPEDKHGRDESETKNYTKAEEQKPPQAKTSDSEHKSVPDVNSVSKPTSSDQGSKLPDYTPAEETSSIISKSNECILDNQLKALDRNLEETKSVDENFASDLKYNTDVNEKESNSNDAVSHETISASKESYLTTGVSLDINPSDSAQKNLSATSEENSIVLDLDTSTTASYSVNAELEKDGFDERPVREMLVRRRYSESADFSEKPVLETLTFGLNKMTPHTSQNEEPKAESDTEVCVCLLCDRSYPADNKDILAHLVLMHKFVIADVNFIANLPAYLRYWKARFMEKPISDFCSKIVTNTGAKDQAPKEEFYLLCDALLEDKSIREHLQRKKLESVLAQQQKEREETKFCRQCLFCKQTFCGNRAVLFDHLLRDHTFHMGQPDNLVYTDELFDLIQSKLDNQLCLFCEKSFKDKASLREHMRKKQHRKINPKNKEYDRFYVVNYMEMGKNWESLQSEDNRLIKSNEKDTDEEEEWSGWNEESESQVVCLFCDSAFVIQADLQQHMKERHSFDLQEVNNRLQLNFYQKVKLINYIRRQVYHKTCYGCFQAFENKDKLLAHFDEFSDHIKKIPDAAIWDQPQYFFPTYEDDCLLCHLDDDDEGAAGDALGVMVIAETIPVTETILEDQKLCRDLKS